VGNALQGDTLTASEEDGATISLRLGSDFAVAADATTQRVQIFGMRAHATQWLRCIADPGKPGELQPFDECAAASEAELL
jgi:hypothetical protein